MYKVNLTILVLAVVAITLPGQLFAQENKLGPDGNAGIGTLSPISRLSIESADTTVANMVRLEHRGISNSTIFMGTAPANYPVLLQRKANVLESYMDLHISAANTGKIYFETGRTGTAAPIRMTLDNVGLGIGTTFPTTSLNVNGGAIRHKNPAGYPYGINIDVDFPGGWSREYSLTYGATGKMFAWGANGNGSTLNYAYIGGNSTAEVVSTTPWMVFRPDGNVGIGTTTPGTYKLAVEGAIGARRVKVTQSAWADFVFHPDYQLPSLKEVEEYIKANRHLPEIPSAADVEKEGLDLGEMNKKLLQKVEELTLYLIQLRKENDEMKKQNDLLIMSLQERIKTLEEK